MSLPEPILILGGYGYRNVGDEAILAGLLRTLTGRRVTVVSRAPAETTALHGVPSIAPQRALVALLRHQTVLIGGGGLFGRDMGLLGRLLPLYGLLAHAAGRTLIVEGVGVDAGMTGVNRRLVVRLLGKADQVTVRDRTSARVLAEWGVAALVGDDLSARMPSAPPRAGRELLRTSGVDGRSPVVGLCLTAVNPEIAPAVADGVAELMRLRPEWQFCFVPMSQHPFVGRHNDLLLARSLQARSPRLKVVEGAHHPGAILSLFGALDAMVAMRYHALLFAERSGTPLVAVPYAEKDERWLADHGRRAVAPSGRALSRALLGSMPARSKAS